MIDKIKITIAREVKERFPELEEVILPVYGVTVGKDETILTKEDYDRQLAKFTGEDFYNQEVLVDFREFCEMLGADLKRNPPSVEFLYRRYQKSGYIPHINTVVDSANKVAVETLVATGVFDMDQIEGDLVLRFSREGEEFRPLGGDIEQLPAGLTVIADDRKILNLFPFRDSIYQKITEKTKNVLILADNLSFETREAVTKAVQLVGELIVKYSGGTLGEVSLSETEEKAKVVFGSKAGVVSEKKKRILTGDTPTGKLHLGHFVGTLENRVKLQNDYETFIILADLHSFTTLAENPEKVRESTIQVLLDNLAVGLDPKCVHFFVESQIPELYELACIYSMLVPYARAMRNPTVKDEIISKGKEDSYSLGFINYPIFQAADITCVGANLVPVGKDQLPHVEQTREIVEKFNSLYGETLVMPEALVGRVGKLIGTDGNPKMGKSLGNTIELSASAEEVKQKIKGMYTDPNRIHPTDPGKVEGNPVFIYHDNFNLNKEEVEDLKKRYKEGKVGDVEVKEKLAIVLNNFLEPIRERRKYYEQHMDEVMEILREGTRITREETIITLEKVREATRLKY